MEDTQIVKYISDTVQIVHKYNTLVEFMYDVYEPWCTPDKFVFTKDNEQKVPIYYNSSYTIERYIELNIYKIKILSTAISCSSHELDDDFVDGIDILHTLLTNLLRNVTILIKNTIRINDVKTYTPHEIIYELETKIIPDAKINIKDTLTHLNKIHKELKKESKIRFPIQEELKSHQEFWNKWSRIKA